VAQDTTRYGTDIYGEHKLTELIQRISKIEGIEWIRLLYCYPEEIDDELIDEIAKNDKVCKYIDIPIQHISDKILKGMGRRGTSEEIKNLITKLRSRIPGIVIRTTFIVGFPGETGEDFKMLYDFVEEYKFERMGVFTYSKEEGTPAARLKPQVSKKVKEKRLDSLMRLQKNISIENNKKRLSKKYRAIVEGVSDDGIFYYGRTSAEAPEIDGVIYFASAVPLETGDIVDVKILNVDEYDLIGEVTDESAQ
jgi:ribosomal protein S12 methylthiotransferase